MEGKNSILQSFIFLVIIGTVNQHCWNKVHLFENLFLNIEYSQFL